MSEQVLNSDHLLPCPFCGAKPVRRINNDILFIECRECVSIGFHNHVRLGCQADQEWNRRTEAASNEWLERRESVKGGEIMEINAEMAGRDSERFAEMIVEKLREMLLAVEMACKYGSGQITYRVLDICDEAKALLDAGAGRIAEPKEDV